MTLKDIAIVRLINQQIAISNFNSAKDLIAWMGAMQAQDFPMAKWAVGLRMPVSTQQLIEMAFDKGEIFRTHLLRPTWHFVSAEDLYWMIQLSAPQIFPEPWAGNAAGLQMVVGSPCERCKECPGISEIKA
jgi:hypothetical protein